MVDFKLIKKICNFTCDCDDVGINQTTMHYDENNPFKKYYKLETILKAINKCKNKEISDPFLAHWCSIYSWILNGGFSETRKEKYKSKIYEYIRWEISDVLDSLSFYDGSIEYDLNQYIVIQKFRFYFEEYSSMERIFQSDRICRI